MKVGKTPAPVELLTFHIDDTPAGATLHRVGIDLGERAVHRRLGARPRSNT
jgi:hypothetical protein